MKLSDHYSRASVLSSLAVLFAGAVIYFFAITYIAHSQLDKNLLQALAEAEEYARTSHQSPQFYDLDQDHAVFSRTDVKALPRRFYDTIYRNPRERKQEAGRAVEDLIRLRDANYKVTITISREGTRYLIGVISMITLALIIGLLIVLFLLNKYVLKGLWHPFFQTLTQIKAFNVADGVNFDPKPSKVDEFTELNQAIYDMSGRVKGDYQTLKQFTENVSHELMTPLAVVKTKLDTLIQDEALSSGQLDQLQDIYLSINRSTRLNQSLLLLIKLDNQLIRDEERLNLKACLLEKIVQFQELLQAKNILLVSNLVDREILASKYLIDMMLNNLFSNAIRHNFVNGEIAVSLTRDQLVLQNSGNRSPLNKNQLFERFKKAKDSPGTGLGLTLVKSICSIIRWGSAISMTLDNTFL